MLSNIQNHTFRTEILSHVGPVVDLAFTASLIGKDAKPEWGFSITLNDHAGTNFYAGFDSEEEARKERGRLTSEWLNALAALAQPQLMGAPPSWRDIGPHGV